MSNLAYRLIHRHRLPHYQPEGATLFITFRLAGSLPREVLARLMVESKAINNVLHMIADDQERIRQADIAQRKQFDHWDAQLAVCSAEPQWLKDRRIATLVAEALRYRDGKVYNLLAYCIMPNHVHVVATPLAKPDTGFHSLSSILHSLKSYTGRLANECLQRSGDFWQHESYDHVVRSEAELNRVVEYVVHNPVKAGLVSQWEKWEWTYVKGCGKAEP